MNKPIGPPNWEFNKHKPINDKLTFCIIFAICTLAFILGLANCRVGWARYKDKEDCVNRIVLAVEKRKEVIDLDLINRINEYCDKYDR